MTTSATTTRKAKGQRRGRPLGGGRRAKVQGDDPVLRAVEKMVEAPDFPWARAGDGMLRHEIFYPDFPWPSDNEGNLLREVFGLVRSGVRGLPYGLAIEGEKARISAPDVLCLAWDFIDGKLTKADFWAELGRVSSSFRAIVTEKEWEESERRGLDDDLLQFHVWREAEEDRKRVCPALPKAELRSVLAALCNRDWTRMDQWVRVESLRRWLAMSPEAIRQAAGSGRWRTDIKMESPESRRVGSRMGAVIEIMQAVQECGRELSRDLIEEGAAAGVDAPALLRLSWRRKDNEITEASYGESLGRVLVMDKDTQDRAIRFCRWAVRTHLKLSSPRRGRRGGKPSYLLGPRAVARVLRAYAVAGGELIPEANRAAATLDRIGREQARRGRCPKIPPLKRQ